MSLNLVVRQNLWAMGIRAIYRCTDRCKTWQSGGCHMSLNLVVRQNLWAWAMGIRAIYRCTDGCKTWQSGRFPG